MHFQPLEREACSRGCRFYIISQLVSHKRLSASFLKEPKASVDEDAQNNKETCNNGK